MARIRSPPMQRALEKPWVFTRISSYLDAKDVHALLSSSRQLRALFDDTNIRDIILTRLVPYYSAHRRSPPNDIPLSFHHLILFSVSQNYPLHLYPALAPRTIQSFTHNLRLTDLALAHSRLVLWLQARVHFGVNGSGPSEPHQPNLLENIAPLVPQLTFPEPLYFSAVSTEAPRAPTRPKLSYKKTLSQLFRSTGPLPPPAKEPRAIKTFTNSWRRRPLSHLNNSPDSYSDSECDFSPPRRLYVKGSRTSRSNVTSMSSFSRSSSPTPPTSASPSPPPSQYRFTPSVFTSPHDFSYAALSSRAPVLRTYCPSAESRLTQDSATVVACEEQLMDAGLWNHLSVGDVICNLAHVPVDETFFSTINKGKQPTNTADLADLSNDGLRPQPSRPTALNWLIYNGAYLAPLIPSEPVPIQNALALPSPFYYTHIFPRYANPMFSLSKMPRYRGLSTQAVDMPLSRRPTSVYNPVQQSPSPKTSRRRVISRHSQVESEQARAASTYGPPVLDLRFSSVNQASGIVRDRRRYDHKGVELRLVNLPAKVPTLHPRAGGPGGYALVKRYSWITRVCVGDISESIEWDGGDDVEMGPGWKGEWVLEGEGTKEGRDLLLQWLDGKEPPVLEDDDQTQESQESAPRGWKWELVRERCTKHRIWLRLMENVKPAWIDHDDVLVGMGMDMGPGP